MVAKKSASAAKPRQNRPQGVRARTRMVMWARAAGRCQYPGCNKLLIGDLSSGAEDRNFGFVAHLVAEAPTVVNNIVIQQPPAPVEAPKPEVVVEPVYIPVTSHHHVSARRGKVQANPTQVETRMLPFHKRHHGNSLGFGHLR